MIRVPEVAPPSGWDAIRARGDGWLTSHPAGRPPSYWREGASVLAAGFGDRCGWTAMFAPHGEIDHFKPLKTHRAKAYEWANLRYISRYANGRKRDADVLDPYAVADDWFELIWPSLELRLTDAVPAEHRRLAEATPDRLGLRHDEEVIRLRRRWLEMYERGTPIELIRSMAPLVASMIDRTRTPSSVPS